MKDSNFVTKTIAVVGVVAVMIYFAVNIAGYLINPLTTTTAYLYVVRDEQVLPDSEGLLYITRAEGEKVAKGKGVATVYHDQETLTQAQTLEQLQLQLEQLEYLAADAQEEAARQQLDPSLREQLVELDRSWSPRYGQPTLAERYDALYRRLYPEQEEPDTDEMP